MEWQISTILRSNLLKKRTSIYSLMSSFSATPNRPSTRGASGSRSSNDSGDPQFEDAFLRGLNFGDNNNDSEVIRGTNRGNSVRGVSGEDDFFAELDDVDDNEEENMGKQKNAKKMRERSFRNERFSYRGEQRGEFKQRLDFESIRDNRRDGFVGHGGPIDKEKGIGETLFEKLNLGKNNKESEDKLVEGSSVGGSLASQDADEIFKKMKETGLIPNAVAMLDGLCKDGLIQEAMKLFGLMREKGMIPEVVIYTAVVEGFCKALKFDDAKRIFRKMQNSGIEPNAFSYGVIIQGLTKGKKRDDATEFCMEMLGAGHLPNPATFTGLVDLICEEKGLEEAEAIIRQVRERGYAVDEKAVREHMDKKGPYSPMVWEAIFGKKATRRPF